MKKYYKFIFIALFGLFIFLPKDTFAKQISYQQPTFYWQGYRVGTNNMQSHSFKANDNQLYQWGSSPNDYTLVRNGILLDYTTLGSSNYQIKARFYLSVPYFPLTNSGTATCSIWASDIYNSSCSIDNISFDYNSGISGNIDYYYDVTYNFYTYGSSYVELWLNYNDMILAPSITYFAYNLMSFEGQIDNSSIIVDQNSTIINQNQQTNQKIDETNEELGELNDNLTSEEAPNLDSLNDSAGWLPPGPVDSILNLPLSLFQNLTDNLSKSCQPVTANLPYVNKTITLPCISTLYEQIGVQDFLNWVGIVVGALILYNYFLKLYQWVDDTLTFRENNWQDWGGV